MRERKEGKTMTTRRLMTKGLYNARDLGGFPTKDGKTTRFGVFVRSEAPVDLPETDLTYLKEYGVTGSVDLRSTGESQARPSDLKGLMPYYHRPLFHEAAIPGAGGPKPKPPQQQGWGEQYISMAEESRDWAKEVLTIAAENQGALLYHCTTGKDRTGLMTCYLLSIAGVGREDIAADYCVSQVFLEPVYEKMRSGAMNLGLPPQGDKPGAKPPQGEGQPPMGPPMDDNFFKTPAEAMLTLIDYLTKTYGGVVEYLREIGIPQETMDAIREKLVEK
jgi:protein-tyrosine phosphatase